MAYVYKSGKVWYVRYKDPAGRWQRKSCGKKATRPEADYIAKEYSAKELNYYHKLPVRMIGMNLVEALKKFQKEVLPRSPIGVDKQESSIRRERSAVQNIIDFVSEKGITKFRGFDKETAHAYMALRKKEGIAPRTQREELRLMKGFFKWAIKQHFCVENPAEDIVAPKDTKKKPRYFSVKELVVIFSLAKEPYRTIFQFLFLTGLRIGELANLIWDDWDDETQRLKIRVVSADKKNRIPGNKTKHEESIPLCQDAVNILEIQRAAEDSDSFIFLNGGGTRLDDDNVYRNLARILKKAGIKNGHPHTFRHSFASHLAIMGVSLYVIKELLRHKSIRETEIYAHLSRETTRNAVEMLRLPNPSMPKLPAGTVTAVNAGTPSLNTTGPNARRDPRDNLFPIRSKPL